MSKIIVKMRHVQDLNKKSLKDSANIGGQEMILGMYDCS
jgi:hypothetical protein